jgi:hypothetical protein
MSTEKNCIDCGCIDNTAPVMPPLGSGGDCPNPEPCSTITSAQCVVFTGNDKLCGEDTVYESGDRLPTILSNIVDYFCGRLQADPIIPVSLSELQTIISDSELIGGRLYNITDRGIFLQALSNNTLTSEGSRVMRIVKPEYYVPATGILGVWNPTLTPTIGDVVVWGGRVWQNVAGAVGTFTGDLTLDSEWTLIATSNDTYYQTKAFGCTYDIDNDWVSKQWDERGNVFTYSYYFEQLNGFNANPLDFSDWGDLKISDNKTGFIINNSNTGRIFANSTLYIKNNSNLGNIELNNTKGIIENNSNNGFIGQNNINFNIYNNSNNGSILENMNRGYIGNNSNNGDIGYNLNGGMIDGITSGNNNIIYNTNNGNIVTTTTGDISDPIVNK